MRKQSKILFFIAFLAIILFASVPLFKLNSLNLNQESVHKTIKKPKKKKVHRITWGYPFEKLYHKKIKFKSGQKYGKTDILRRTDKPSYFHDGYDFGFSEVGHSPVLAVHSGIVHKVKYYPGMGLCIWVISKDGYVEIYQEGFLSITDIYVKKGQHIKLGQKIGKLTGSHLHLGITKTNKHYIDKHGIPCGNWWKDNGTWLNPMKIIKNDIAMAKKGK